MKRFLILLLLFFTTESFATGIGNVASAPCDNATLSKYTGTADIEINWEPNTIGLKWFNGDQQIAGPTSCVYDSTLTVPPQPTKPGYTFNGWKVWKITVPDGYTQLEYLQGTGTQYITTTYTPNNNTGVKTKIQFDSVTNSQSFCFGSAITFNDRAFELYPWEGKLEFNYGGVAGGGMDINVNDVLELDWDKRVLKVKINGGNIMSETLPARTFTSPYPMKIFTLARPSNNNSGGKIKIYYFQIYENEVLMHNLIPARRNSDNILGMFDTVSGNFLTNSGTGTFVAGPVVQ